MNLPSNCLIFHPTFVRYIDQFDVQFSLRAMLNVLNVIVYCLCHCIVFVGSAVALSYNVSDLSIVIGHSFIALLFHFTPLVFILLWQKLVVQL